MLTSLHAGCDEVLVPSLRGADDRCGGEVPLCTFSGGHVGAGGVDPDVWVLVAAAGRRVDSRCWELIKPKERLKAP